MSAVIPDSSYSGCVVDDKKKREMEEWKGTYMMTSWENYAEFLQKLGVSLLLRKLATLGTPIVEVSESNGEWNIRRTTTIFYRLVKLRAVDFKFRIGERFDEVTPDKREVSSIVTVDGNKFIHKSTAKVEGVTGHTVITEFNGDNVTRYMTIDKVPECIGVMKFTRMQDGEEKNQEEIDLDD
jgi:fatty acid-binding protein 3